MGERGLAEVENPSALFLGEGGERAAGTAVFAGIEGSRPVLVEFQALVARLGAYGTPRRAVVGWDGGRLAMVLAVLEARCGLGFGDARCLLERRRRTEDHRAGGGSGRRRGSGVLGPGVRPASGLRGLRRDQPFGRHSERVGRSEMRLKEAAKLGFSRALAPLGAAGGRRGSPAWRARRGGGGDRRECVGRSGDDPFDLVAGLILAASLHRRARPRIHSRSDDAGVRVAAAARFLALRFTGPIAGHCDPYRLAGQRGGPAGRVHVRLHHPPPLAGGADAAGPRDARCQAPTDSSASRSASCGGGRDRRFRSGWSSRHAAGALPAWVIAGQVLPRGQCRRRRDEPARAQARP